MRESRVEQLADLVTALNLLKRLLWLTERSKTVQTWLKSHAPDFQDTATKLIDKYPRIKGKS